MMRSCSIIISFFALLVTALLVDRSDAFLPQRMMTSPSVWGVSQCSEPGKLFSTSEADVDAFRHLGKKQLKKSARVEKRQSNLAATPPKAAKSTLQKSVGKSSVANNPLRIIIAGAPASGKGTQCELIKEKYGVIHLSTGDMLRAAVAAGTEVGKAAKEYMDSGKLVPDDVIIGVVKDRLESDDCKNKGWLLDGFPRTQAQAAALADAGVTADCFLYLDVPDEVLVERVVGRRTDPETGKIYHMTFSPPEDEEVKARLEQRSDDTEEKVKVRLEQFHANVDAVKGSYTDISVDVDGTKPPPEVAASIDAALSAKVAA